MEKISSYILTKNSEKYLKSILDKLDKFSDEIIVVDSGSLDNTEIIAKSYAKVKFLFKEFLNFKDQRIFAERVCSYDIIYFNDSDEIPSDEMVISIGDLKNEGFPLDAYRISREWYVLGKKIHSIYPIVSPDNPIRVYNKRKVSFYDSTMVHETLTGYKCVGKIQGVLMHLTFETKAELWHKLDFYTTIASQDLIKKKKNITFFNLILNPISAFVKWFILKNGYRDGYTGLILARYAFLYTLLKYKKVKLLKQVS